MLEQHVFPILRPPNPLRLLSLSRPHSLKGNPREWRSMNAAGWPGRERLWIKPRLGNAIRCFTNAPLSNRFDPRIFEFQIPFFFLSFFYTFNEEFFDTRFEEEPLPRTLRNRIFERVEIISAAQFSRCVRLSA